MAADGASADQDLSSTVQVTGASAISEERTLQYLVIESSTARAALACVVPGAVMVKCKTAEARRRGVAATRCASIITWSALTGLRCFCSIVTTSVDAQVAMDASSISKGPGAVVASPSIRILGPRGRPAWNSRPPIHSTSIAAACGTVADCDFDIRFNRSVVTESARPARRRARSVARIVYKEPSGGHHPGQCSRLDASQRPRQGTSL